MSPSLPPSLSLSVSLPPSLSSMFPCFPCWLAGKYALHIRDWCHKISKLSSEDQFSELILDPFQANVTDLATLTASRVQIYSNTNLHYLMQPSIPVSLQVLDRVSAVHPTVPLVLYVNGSGGLLERLQTTGAHVIGLDWTVDMADARARLGPSTAVQGNVDPAVLFAAPEAITEAIKQ